MFTFIESATRGLVGNGEDQHSEVRRQCPVCNGVRSEVAIITPRHTLKARHRPLVDPNGDYHFCASPDCDVVYFDRVNGSLFKREHLINRVTIKDEHPKTPLCYCFKVLKEDALKELAQTGTTDVGVIIRERMKERGCQCEKFNPRGSCCSKDIEAWLIKQGVDPQTSRQASACCDSDDDAYGGCSSESGTKDGCGC